MSVEGAIKAAVPRLTGCLLVCIHFSISTDKNILSCFSTHQVSPVLLNPDCLNSPHLVELYLYDKKFIFELFLFLLWQISLTFGSWLLSRTIFFS